MPRRRFNASGRTKLTVDIPAQVVDLKRQFSGVISRSWDHVFTQGISPRKMGELVKKLNETPIQLHGDKYIVQLDYETDTEIVPVGPHGGQDGTDCHAEEGDTTAAVTGSPSQNWVHSFGSKSFRTKAVMSAMAALVVCVASVGAFLFFGRWFTDETKASLNAESMRHADSATIERSSLQVLVSPRGTKKALDLSEASMPLAYGDAIRLVVESPTPRYHYVLWLDPSGMLSPVWPWEDFAWDTLPTHPTKSSQLAVPHSPSDFLNLSPPPQGPRHDHGIHAIILVAVDEPIHDFDAIKTRFHGKSFTPGLIPELEELVIRIDDGRLATIDYQQLGPSSKRFPVLTETRVDNPVLSIQRIVQEMLPEVMSIQTVCFPLGERSE